MIEVTLTFEEGLSGVQLGGYQQMRRLKEGRRHDRGKRSRRRESHRFGDQCVANWAEVAVCKALNRNWTPGCLDFVTGDVSGEIEVRHTEYRSGHLFIYETDKADRYFILVIGVWPCFRRCGFFQGEEQDEEKWRVRLRIRVQSSRRGDGVVGRPGQGDL